MTQYDHSVTYQFVVPLTLQITRGGLYLRLSEFQMNYEECPYKVHMNLLQSCNFGISFVDLT